jgi:5'-3' exonuclease
MTRSVAARSDPDALYLIDSSIYVFQAWHTHHATVDISGRPSHAAVGFTEFLFQLIQRRRPTQLVCAFDESHGRSDRHAIYPEYKANRPPAPPDLKHQFALCKSFVGAAGIAAQASTAVEADDIIGTLAAAARAQDTTCVIVSADKDLCQFVGPADAIWDYTRDTWMDARLIEKRFGVRPHQIPDLLALTGDKVDNIPGVPGVGIATAAKLLVKWGNLDLLLDNIPKVAQMKFRGAPHTAVQLQAHVATVRLSRQLTGLQSYRIPDALLLHIEPDRAELEHMCDILQFSDQKKQGWFRLLEC